MSLRNGSPDPFRTPNPLKQQHSHLAQFVSCSSPFQEFFITTFKFTSNSNFWLSNTRRSVSAKREVKTAQLFNTKFLPRFYKQGKHYVILEYNTKQRFFKIRLSLIFFCMFKLAFCRFGASKIYLLDGFVTGLLTSSHRGVRACEGVSSRKVIHNLSPFYPMILPNKKNYWLAVQIYTKIYYSWKQNIFSVSN